MSNEELQKQIDDLQNRLNTIEKAQNIDMNALLFESLLHDKTDYADNLKRTVSVNATPYNFQVPEDPIGALQINYKGTNYRILLYSLS